MGDRIRNCVITPLLLTFLFGYGVVVEPTVVNTKTIQSHWTGVIQSFDFLITCEGITLLCVCLCMRRHTWCRGGGGGGRGEFSRTIEKQEGSVYDMRKLIGRKGDGYTESTVKRKSLGTHRIWFV